jgi:hypothetical protein
VNGTLKPYSMPQPVIPAKAVIPTKVGIQASPWGWIPAQDRKGPLPQPVIPTKVGIQASPWGWIPAFPVFTGMTAGMTHIPALVIPAQAGIQEP